MEIASSSPGAPTILNKHQSPTDDEYIEQLIDKYIAFVLSSSFDGFGKAIDGLKMILVSLSYRLDISMTASVLQSVLLKCKMDSLSMYTSRFFESASYFTNEAIEHVLSHVQDCLMNSPTSLFDVLAIETRHESALLVLSALMKCANLKVTEPMEALLTCIFEEYLIREGPSPYSLELLDACTVGILQKGKVLSANDWLKVQMSKEKQSLGRILRLHCQLFDVLSAEGARLESSAKVMEMIQSGLISPHSNECKFASFLLKRIVDEAVSEIDFPGKIHDDMEDRANFYSIKAITKSEFELMWQDFFLVFETIQEMDMHLISPVLPRMNALLDAISNGFMHPTWFILVLKKALQSDSEQIRRFMILLVLRFTCDTPLQKDVFVKCVLEDDSFIFDAFFKALEAPFLYVTPYEKSDNKSFELGGGNSFGEEVTKFIGNCLQKCVEENLSSNGDSEVASIERKSTDLTEIKLTDKIKSNCRLTQWFDYIIRQCEASSNIASSLYMLHALANTSFSSNILSTKHMNSFVACLSGKSLGNVWGKSMVKRLLQKYVWAILMRHLDYENSNFTVFSRLLFYVCPISEGAVSEFIEFETWLHSFRDEWVFYNAEKALKEILCLDGDSEANLLYAQQLSKTMALLFKNNLNRSKQLQVLFHPFCDRLLHMQHQAYSSSQTKLNILQFLTCFLKDMRPFDISVHLPRLLDCMDELFSYADSVFVGVLANELGRSSTDRSDNLSVHLSLVNLLLVLCVGDSVSKSNMQMDVHVVSYKPLLLNLYPSFKILDLMDLWREHCIHQLRILAAESPASVSPIHQSAIIRHLTLLNLTLQSQIALDGTCPKCPMSSNDLNSLMKMLFSLKEMCEFTFPCLQSLFQWIVSYKIAYDQEIMTQAIEMAMDSMKQANSNEVAQVFCFLCNVLDVFPVVCAADLIMKTPLASPLLFPVSSFQSLVEAGLDTLKSVWTPSHLYFGLLQSMVDFCFHPKIMIQIVYFDSLDFLVGRLMNDAQKRIGIMSRVSLKIYLLIRELIARDAVTSGPCAIYKSSEIILSSANLKAWFLLYSPILVKLLLFGPLRVKEKEIGVASFAYQRDSKEEAQSFSAHKDAIVRVHLNASLLQFAPAVKEHSDIAVDLAMKLVQILKNEEVKYPGTIEDARRVRVWTSLHCLVDVIAEEWAEELMHSFIALLSSSSIRYYTEWAICRLLLKFSGRLSVPFWKYLQNFSLKPHVASSLFTIAAHAMTSLPLDDRRKWSLDGITCILPWTMSHHFTVRLLSQFSIMKLKSHGETIEQSVSHREMLPAMFGFLSSPETQKQLKKLESSYFISQHDPILDVNIKFIFDEGLRHCSVNERIDSTWFAAFPCRRLPLERRMDTVPDTSLFTENGILKDDSNNENIPRNEKNINGNIRRNETKIKEESLQKKMIPWQDLLQSDFWSPDRQKKTPFPFIVVASCVDKVPNLAGLCRTMEIFNGEALVVRDLKIKDDIQFKSISVTAGGWVPMNEVPEANLAAYLQEQKARGYVVIGLEQTTTSVSLAEYAFPRDCVLVLGNERRGIPASLLALLDVVLEIPQFGVIRSLNVHVSGALCLWEYIKQKRIA